MTTVPSIRRGKSLLGEDLDCERSATRPAFPETVSTFTVRMTLILADSICPASKEHMSKR
jgi:hypothetical protein